MDVGIIIVGAGLGTRMQSSLSKVLHPLAGLPMLNHVIHSVLPLKPNKLCIVASKHNFNEISNAVKPLPIILQEEPNGTGDAVIVTKDFFSCYKEGTIVILYGDTPLVTSDIISDLVKSRLDNHAGISLLTFISNNPTGYGRVLVNENDFVDSIVEEKDATEQEKAVRLCNSGVLAVDAELLYDLLDKVDNNNANQEYYLTDIVDICNKFNHRVVYIIANEEDVMGVDSKMDLAKAEYIYQSRLRNYHLSNGVLMQDSKTVYFSWDTKIGKDVIIEPNVVFRQGVHLYDGVKICSFSYIEGCVIGNNSIIGPYARIRSSTRIGSGVKLGNFVEVKQSTIKDGTKVGHLSYIGDSELGLNTNIGAGTITCNYDGKNKYKTLIGNDVFIGSNSSLIAPLSIDKGAFIGAGSVITKDVEANSLSIGRSEQINIFDGASRLKKKERK